MNPARIAFIPPATRDALESYLYRTRSALTPAQAVAAAVALWLEHQKSANSFSLRGYQWKQLFLPEGSCLRMTYKEMTFYAKVTRRLDQQPLSSADAISEAAKAMTTTLGAAMLLIKHVDHQSTTITERRLPKNRREYDLMDDDH
ncbi:MULTISPECIES: hypothetical protein [unclassified Duganella]|uniref:hypothetical protein n=1 Tax=unclassified Duganella TaxID=2636909 RepID=UPI000885D79A|nr:MULTISPECIES: hypothetical protein [unclassified Duganella]SDH31816.1 hypothetical protein SAMN05216320_11225 [Duganella sp. OV458]SDK48591.1 hypothetical protein SAMN05428973_11225 [Duganella sp. OV510]